MFILDEKGWVLDLNPAAEQLFGRVKDSMLGRGLSEVLHAQADCLEQPLGVRFHLEAARSDGARLWLDAYRAQLSGGPTPVFAVFLRDWTAQRAAQQALQGRCDLLQAVTEGANDAMFVKDLQGQYLLINGAAAQAFGRSIQEILGKDALELFPLDMAQDIQEADRRIIETGRTETYEDLATHGDKPRIYLTTKGPYRDGEGKIVGVFGVARDITEWKQAAVSILEWKERYEAASLASRHILYDYDIATQGVTYGGAVMDILGYTLEEMQGGLVRWMDLVHPDDRKAFEAEERRCRVDTTPFHLEYRLIRKDGSIIFVQDDGSLILSPDGQLVRVVGFVVDKTERKSMEMALAQFQKMEAIGRLAGGVAHDFNNVLTVILGYSDMLSSTLDGNSEALEQLTGIKDAAERAATLTRQLLAFSRKQVFERVALDLNVVLADTEKMLQRSLGEDIEILTRTGRSLWRVLADPGQLGHILLNLALNARDAMPRGGSLILDARNFELDPGFERPGSRLSPGPYVLLSIRDSGSGMDEATCARLFEPFFTTKGLGGGIGLGLATVYGIVQQLGGHIEVESRLGQGTTFRIYLPAVHAAGSKEGPSMLLLQDLQGSETILLVEDEDDVRAMLRTNLKARGYNVIDSGRGHEALLMAQEHPTAIHLLITDVVMPRMGGVELAVRLRAALPGLKVLFISGYVDDDQVRNQLLEPNSAFLQKPFPLKALARQVREMLDSLQPQTQALPVG